MELREVDSVKYMLRKATKIVKLYPFIYAALYLMCMAAYYVIGGALISVLDILFTITPIAIIPFIGLSRTFKLCKWHRLQCVILTFPVIPETYQILTEPSFLASVLSVSIGVIIFLLSILNAYFMFIKK